MTGPDVHAIPSARLSFFDREFEAHAKSAALIAEYIPRVMPDIEDIRPPRPKASDALNPLHVLADVEFLEQHKPEQYRQLAQLLRDG